MLFLSKALPDADPHVRWCGRGPPRGGYLSRKARLSEFKFQEVTPFLTFPPP